MRCRWRPSLCQIGHEKRAEDPDSALHKADARKAVYSSIEIGHSYTFTVVGKPLGDSYPAIIEVTETG